LSTSHYYLNVVILACPESFFYQKDSRQAGMTEVTLLMVLLVCHVRDMRLSGNTKRLTEVFQNANRYVKAYINPLSRNFSWNIKKVIHFQDH